MKNQRGTLTKFVNCKILRNHSIFKDDIWVRNGKIIDPFTIYYEEHSRADVVVDCFNHLIVPSFIDVQINGAFGVDFSSEVENVEEGVEKVAKGVLAHGVTSFCPTLVTSPSSYYQKIMPKIKKTFGNNSNQCATVLGVHLEGPFISRDKPGAHPQSLIQTFDRGFKDLIKVYGELDNVSIVTLAPELSNSPQVIMELCSRGIRVSLGHSVADLAEGETAVKSGATFITHLFNAMLPFHHRDPGLVGLLTSDAIPKEKKVFYGIIADGIHTHPAAVKIAYRAHPKGLILVTDAIAMMGLPQGIHQLGQQKVEIRDNKALIAGTQTLCGSVATMNECVKNFKQASGCSIVEALECASLHPAQLLGIEHSKGTLNFNADADFIVLDDDINVLATYMAGECVWEKYPGTLFKRNEI